MCRALLLPAVVLTALTFAAPANAASPDLVISEVSGGGGNSGAPLNADFIELYNRGTAPVALAGRSLQYASATGTGAFGATASQLTPLPDRTLAPDKHLLVREATGTSGAELPAPDVTDDSPINLSATAGKVALVEGTSSLGCNGGSAPCTPEQLARIVDLVGYGGANFFEGAAPAPAGSSSTSVTRALGGHSDTDQNAADFAAAPPSPGAGETAPPPPPTDTPRRIADIQGARHRSPLEGERVASVPGIVTAVRTNGYWFQDPQPDGDDRTSEGLFVFTGARPAVAAGDAVSVFGRVAEFRPGGSGGSDNLTTTQLSEPTTLPGIPGRVAPTVVGPGGRVPPTEVIDDDSTGDVEATPTFDPAEDGIDFYESLEGMLTRVNDPVAVGPRSDFGEVPTLAAGGAGASVRTARGGIVIRPGDFNPERIIFDDVIAPTPSVDVRDSFAGPVDAVVDYSFGAFKFLALQTPTVVDGGLEREVTEPSRDDQLSIASFNVENLDPGDPEEKFRRLAETLVTNLRAPDIVGVEEVQDNDGARSPAPTDANLTYSRLIQAIRTAGGPTYDYRQIDPASNQDGGEPNGNIRVGFLYRTDRGVTFVDRPGGTAGTSTEEDASQRGAQLTLSPGRIDPTEPAFRNSRKPLAGEFRFRGRTVIAVVNHFNSKGGDDPLFGRVQPPRRSSEAQRHQQATIVNRFVRELLAADKNANVVVFGDLNDFEFSRTLEILEGQELFNLAETLPQPERYSYVFEGNSQVLDQILVSRSLLSPRPEYDSVHTNAEFADQISDHDPQLARLRVTGGK